MKSIVVVAVKLVEHQHGLQLFQFMFVVKRCVLFKKCCDLRPIASNIDYERLLPSHG